MTLLELIKNGSTNTEVSAQPSKCSFIGARNLPDIEADTTSNPDCSELIHPLARFELSDLDSFINDASSKLFKKLKRKLKNPNSFTLSDFTGLLNSFLEKIGDKIGISVGAKASGVSYTQKLFEKLGSFIGRDAMGLVIEGCVALEIWGLLETLIVNKLVDRGFCSNLVYNLVSKRRSDLICLCLEYFLDLDSSDLCRILKYFLSLSKEGAKTMAGVTKEWEEQASLAIEKATDAKLGEKKIGLAKEASILLMMAYDGFFEYELCLHYLFASSEVDETLFSNVLSSLNVEETLSLVVYLGKWLRKYERFPQVSPCPKAVIDLKLKSCRWIPTLEDVVKSLGLVLDVHFFSLTLHAEFHQELKALVEVVDALVSEGRICCSLANVIEILKPEVAVL
ncbi:hypothetical protein Dimus_029805 [Dionaea muscipula]